MATSQVSRGMLCRGAQVKASVAVGHCGKRSKCEQMGHSVWGRIILVSPSSRTLGIRNGHRSRSFAESVRRAAGDVSRAEGYLCNLLELVLVVFNAGYVPQLNHCSPPSAIL